MAARRRLLQEDRVQGQPRQHSQILGGKWVWAAPRRVAVVALAVPPGPVNVRAKPGEDGALEPGLAGVGAGGGRGGDRPCRR